MFTKQELMAMAWGYCFSIPSAILCVWLGAPVWAIGLVLAAGFIPTLLKLNE